MNALIRLLALTTALLAAGPWENLVAHPRETGDDPVLFGALFPRLSADGSQIAYSYLGAIWRGPREGGEMVQLTVDKGFDVNPAWSPDGESIAFIRGENSFVGQLQIIRARDGLAVSLPREIVARDRLFFDLDGTRILGSFRQPEGGFKLCWLDTKTGTLGDQLHPVQWDLRYALSHDGRSIVLATTQDVPGEQGGNFGPQCDLWVMSAEGGQPRRIVRFPGRIYEVEWAHDNKAIYVVSNVGGVHNDLWLVPLADPARGAVRLTFGQADEDSPTVSCDGGWLVYTDNHSGPTALVVRNRRIGQDFSVTASKMVYQQATGELSLQISDESEGGPVTARVAIRQKEGKYYAPPGTLYRMLRGDVHFYCEGRTRFSLPAGRYLLKVARGPEYPVFRKEFQVSANQLASVAVKLRRWTNQRKRGWYSGESHIHANYGYGQWYNSPRTMLAQGAGEDLIVCNFMVANSEADGVFDREYFRGEPDPMSTFDTVLYWNEEFRSTLWGHLNLLNLKRLVEPIFTGFLFTTHPHDHPTNADIADLTHEQNGHVNYTHPAHNLKDPYLSAYSAKALPLDVALGTVDSVDVMGSNHEATMLVWYRLLNCGFRIPASAGTDCFLNRLRSKLPGEDRVYVRIPGEFSYQRWIDGLQAGNTFVTNGPMMELSVDGREPGEQVNLDRPGEVRLKGRVRSRHPLNRVEIVCNGQVVVEAKPSGQTRDVSIDERISISTSGWIALRAAGEDHPDQPYGSVFGHTSPVYLEVAGHPVDARKEGQYFVNWIDRLYKDVQRRNRIPGRHVDHVTAQIARARAVFNKLVHPDE